MEDTKYMSILLPLVNSVDNGPTYYKQETEEFSMYMECSNNQLAIDPEPSPTGKVPCFNIYPGPYNFRCEVQSEESDRAKWLYSKTLNMLFVNMCVQIDFRFKWDWLEDDLFIRALLVYTSEDHQEYPVVRCPRHAMSQEEVNQDFPVAYLDHVIRCGHHASSYCQDTESKRLSVVVPVGIPPPETDWQTINYLFTCKNSCSVGMNRRKTALIFTLERNSGQVIGRQVMKVRVCSCPKRDKEKHEKDHLSKPMEESFQTRPTKRLMSKELPARTCHLESDDGTIMFRVKKTEAASIARVAYGAVLLENRILSEQDRILLDEYKRIISDYVSAMPFPSELPRCRIQE